VRARDEDVIDGFDLVSRDPEFLVFQLQPPLRSVWMDAG
jgi:hypothetical protein